MSVCFCFRSYTIQYYAAFLKWHENRTDIEGFATLSDPILPLLTPRDLSVPLFFMAYGSIFSSLFYSRKRPDLIIEFLQTNALVICVRMVSSAID